MPVFHYKAVAHNGETVEGDMEVANAAAAIRSIQESGQIPILAEEIRPGIQHLNFSRISRKKKGIGARQVASFTRSLASLMGAGVPLDRGLEIMHGVEDDYRSIKLITDVQQSIHEGGSLSSALDDQGDLFSKFYISMIRAAEASGDISDGLERLVDYLERRQELHDRIVSALIYPVILLTIAGLSVIILLTYVVPQFRSMFDEMGPALPLATRAVLAVSDFVATFGWLGIPLALLAVVAVRHYCGRQEIRLRIDGWLLQLPLTGSLVRDLETARLTRGLGTLLQNGVPMLHSLSIARESLGNRVMANEIDKAISSLTEGGQLSGSLLRARLFPKLAIQLIKVGEETGSLGRTMLNIASIYDRDVNTKIQRLLALLEPVLIIGLGVMIAGIIMSILIGIISINDLPL